MSVYDRPGVSQGHAVKLPILHALFHHPHHLARRHRGPGRNFARLFLTGRQHLDVCPPNVDHENSGSLPRLPTFHSCCLTHPPKVRFFLTHRQAKSSSYAEKVKIVTQRPRLLWGRRIASNDNPCCRFSLPLICKHSMTTPPARNSRPMM